MARMLVVPEKISGPTAKKKFVNSQEVVTIQSISRYKCEALAELLKMLKLSTRTWTPPFWAWLFVCLVIINSVLALQLRHPCNRVCRRHGAPMVCKYDFDVSLWSTMTKECNNCPRNSRDCFAPLCAPGDGSKKIIYSVNKQLPGPLIEVCKGDRLIVNVKNNLRDESTTVHWHGIEQRGTPFMDGVPYITQCPILPSQTYVYNFTVEYSGTYFWHSHSNEQRTDGFLGGLIVREPTKYCKYVVDKHVIILNDWLKISSRQLYAMDLRGQRGPTPHTILINGLGRFPPNTTNNILPVFEVELGKTYRFRVIDAGSQLCPMSLAIENHDLTLISTDGLDIKPVEVESIRLLAGERYDFLLKADKEPRNYWLQVKGVDGTTGCRMAKVYQLAILRYKGAPIADPPQKPSYDMLDRKDDEKINPFNKGIENPFSIVNLNTLWPDSVANTRKPDYQFFATYGQGINNELSNATIEGGRQYTAPNNNNTKTFWRFNSITFKQPPVPLLTQYHMVDPNLLCNSLTVNERQCITQFCECTHTLPVRLNSVVELVLIDKGFVKVNHPIHLHGAWFRVVGMGTFDGPASIDLFKKMDQHGRIVRKLKHAIKKDTTMVPANGYTIVRFHADNPGIWLLHCHFESHARNGLDLVFKVGEVEDFPVAPPSIPRC